MSEFLEYIKSKLNVDKKLIAIYIIVYLVAGYLMNELGTAAEIARFTYWWQIITVYGVYMIPVSLILRGLPFHMQYAYGLIAMAVLEFGGYALQSSYVYPGNIIETTFNIRNFALSMALFFALYFPVGNLVVGKIYSRFIKS
ncbi:MAG: hypothetical protein HKN90_02340 [Flavobacteriaceae bacterium]|nr:hypothetical protein [Flavobacteriaceae bacterium]